MMNSQRRANAHLHAIVLSSLVGAIVSVSACYDPYASGYVPRSALTPAAVVTAPGRVMRVSEIRLATPNNLRIPLLFARVKLANYGTQPWRVSARDFRLESAPSASGPISRSVVALRLAREDEMDDESELPLVAIRAGDAAEMWVVLDDVTTDRRSANAEVPSPRRAQLVLSIEGEQPLRATLSDPERRTPEWTPVAPLGTVAARAGLAASYGNSQRYSLALQYGTDVALNLGDFQLGWMTEVMFGYARFAAVNASLVGVAVGPFAAYHTRLWGMTARVLAGGALSATFDGPRASSLSPYVELDVGLSNAGFARYPLRLTTGAPVVGFYTRLGYAFNRLGGMADADTVTLQMGIILGNI
ncbi:MAG: hypothetical protein IPK60_05740 [Sandaracinaceae bacterium]|nr:hypothetical protein [Sandaracinaceae bacterium]